MWSDERVFCLNLMMISLSIFSICAVFLLHFYVSIKLTCYEINLRVLWFISGFTYFVIFFGVFLATLSQFINHNREGLLHDSGIQLRTFGSRWNKTLMFCFACERLIAIIFHEKYPKIKSANNWLLKVLVVSSFSIATIWYCLTLFDIMPNLVKIWFHILFGYLGFLMFLTAYILALVYSFKKDRIEKELDAKVQIRTCKQTCLYIFLISSVSAFYQASSSSITLLVENGSALEGHEVELIYYLTMCSHHVIISIGVLGWYIICMSIRRTKRIKLEKQRKLEDKSVSEAERRKRKGELLEERTQYHFDDLKYRRSHFNDLDGKWWKEERLAKNGHARKREVEKVHKKRIKSVIDTPKHTRPITAPTKVFTIITQKSNIM
uniref:G_PROTEIN_RECEP_F1_2 domain-containing protein n=1 Tax=Rhabditophanes sp. KR3021 TaxID=114890 RepID=A0AC35U8Q5_9BILA